METTSKLVKLSNGNYERQDIPNTALYFEIVNRVGTIAYEIGLQIGIDTSRARQGFKCAVINDETSTVFSVIVRDLYPTEYGFERDVRIYFDNGDYLQAGLRLQKDTEEGNYNLKLSSFEYKFNEFVYVYYIGKPDHIRVLRQGNGATGLVEDSPYLDESVLERLKNLRGRALRNLEILIADITEPELIREALGSNTIIDTQKRLVVTYKMVGSYPNGQRLETPGNFELKDYDKAIRDGRESLLSELANNIDRVPVRFKKLKSPK